MRLKTVTVSIISAMLMIGVAGASASDIVIQGETLSYPAGSGEVRADGSARGGATLARWNQAPASAEVVTTEETQRVLIRVRGDQCNGAPLTRLTIDGTPVHAAQATSNAYLEYEALTKISPGVHSLAVSMTNDGGGTLLNPCDRNIYVDEISLLATRPIFASDSYRNAALPPSTPVDPLSSRWRDLLMSGIEQTNVTVNSRDYGSPFYVVTKDQPAVAVKQRVALGQSTAVRDELERQWSNTPLPAGAFPSGGTDKFLTVYQPSSDTLWEFWQFERDALGRATAAYGGRLDHVSTNPGYFPRIQRNGYYENYGATATGIPFMAGTTTISELQSGAINHAVDVVIPPAIAHASKFRWPAQRTDTYFGDPRPEDGIPKGTRFRLPANLNIDAMNLPRYPTMLAKAIQRYGMVVRDQGASLSFTSESPRPVTPDPYYGAGGIFEGHQPYKGDLFAGFPWGYLEALEGVDEFQP